MIGFGESLLAWFASTFFPALAGILLISYLGRSIKAVYLSAFAFGIFLWFFVDTLGGSASLDVNAGFGGGWTQVALVILFVVGPLFLFYFESLGLSGSGSLIGGLATATLVAVAVGVHGVGEGAAFGSVAATTPGTDLVEAFGGPSAGAAYVLHKLLESMMVGACFVAYSTARSKGFVELRSWLVLTLAFVTPSMLGFGTGYYLSYDASYLFALGLGTSLYAALKLVGTISLGKSQAEAKEQWVLALLIVIGFLSLYFAALFHS